jgi:hypothetical protein
MVVTSVKTEEKSNLQSVMGCPPLALMADYEDNDIKFMPDKGDCFAYLQSNRMSRFVTPNLRELLNGNLRRLEPSCLEIGVLKFLQSLHIEVAFKLLQNIGEFYTTMNYLGLMIISSPVYSLRTSRSAAAARLQGAAETKIGAAKARVIEKCIFKLGDCRSV